MRHSPSLQLAQHEAGNSPTQHQAMIPTSDADHPPLRSQLILIPIANGLLHTLHKFSHDLESTRTATDRNCLTMARFPEPTNRITITAAPPANSAESFVPQLHVQNNGEVSSGIDLLNGHIPQPGDERVGSDLSSERPRAKPVSKPVLACPFLRFDPDRYIECVSYCLRGYEAVKQHLRRNHRREFYCAICFSFFETAYARDNHARGTGHHTPGPGHNEITPDEWDDALEPKNETKLRSSDDIDKYLWMWTRLFEGHTPPRREEIYLQEMGTEVRKTVYRSAPLESILKGHLPLTHPDTRELAETMRAQLIAAPIDAGPPRYRVNHNSINLHAGTDEHAPRSSSIYSEFEPQCDNQSISLSQHAGPWNFTISPLEPHEHFVDRHNASCSVFGDSIAIASLSTEVNTSLAGQPDPSNSGETVVWETNFAVPWQPVDETDDLQLENEL